MKGMPVFVLTGVVAVIAVGFRFCRKVYCIYGVAVLRRQLSALLHALWCVSSETRSVLRFVSGVAIVAVLFLWSGVCIGFVCIVSFFMIFVPFAPDFAAYGFEIAGIPAENVGI